MQTLHPYTNSRHEKIAFELTHLFQFCVIPGVLSWYHFHQFQQLYKMQFAQRGREMITEKAGRDERGKEGRWQEVRGSSEGLCFNYRGPQEVNLFSIAIYLSLGPLHMNPVPAKPSISGFPPLYDGGVTRKNMMTWTCCTVYLLCSVTHNNQSDVERWLLSADWLLWLLYRCT